MRPISNRNDLVRDLNYFNLRRRLCSKAKYSKEK